MGLKRDSGTSAADLAVAPDLGLDHADHGEVSEAPFVGEAPVGGEPAEVMADEGAAGFDVAVIASVLS